MKHLVVAALLILATVGSIESAELTRITMYTRAECPNKYTSSGKEPQIGFCAVSRDIEKKHRLKFGDVIHVKGVGVYRFMDRTATWIKNTVDIFHLSRHEALEFGAPRKQIRIIR